jgi:hypothetical protein
MKNLHLGHFLGLSAIVLAVAAAFFSVSGLGQLFAGASLAVIIMASALEFSKIIIATFLHNYWGKISKLLRIYLTIAVIVLVTITSAGIYGFLSSAYQHTATELEKHDGVVGLIDSKIGLVNNKIESNQQVIESKLERYNKLMDLREKQEVRLDSMINRRYFSNANLTRNEIEKANNEMLGIQTNVDELTSLNNKLNDSISKFELEKLELKSSSKVAGEIGPLKYMAELTGQSMDVVINFFILLLIFVFDPLAICLVMATNWVFERRKLENVRPEKESVEEETPVKPKKRKSEPVSYNMGTLNEEDSTEGSYTEGEMSPDITEIPPQLDINEVEVVDEEVVKPEPTKTKAITMEEINKMAPFTKGERGFSTKIPEPSSQERRIGSNKILKDGSQVVYKRNNGDK